MLAKPSLRTQWILALTIAAAVVAVVIVVVDRGNQAANNPAPPISRSVVITENHEADVLITQDQAPHVATLRAGASPAAGLTAAVTAFVGGEIAQGTIDGPVERSSCSPAAGGTAGREVFVCTVEASNVNYPFDAVVVPATRQVTYCKRDYPPVPSMNIPVSRRCT